MACMRACVLQVVYEIIYADSMIFSWSIQCSPPVHDDDNYDDYLDSCCLLRGGFRNTDDSTMNR